MVLFGLGHHKNYEHPCHERRSKNKIDAGIIMTSVQHFGTALSRTTPGFCLDNLHGLPLVCQKKMPRVVWEDELIEITLRGKASSMFKNS